eukprot:scpid38594/ scgid9992/ 
MVRLRGRAVECSVGPGYPSLDLSLHGRDEAVFRSCDRVTLTTIEAIFCFAQDCVHAAWVDLGDVIVACQISGPGVIGVSRSTTASAVHSVIPSNNNDGMYT